MSIALVGENWWRAACEAAGEPCRLLPPIVDPPANPYSADVARRTAVGPLWREQLAASDADFILDNGGTGLAFVPEDGHGSRLSLLHDVAHVPLASHLIDPLVTAFQGLPWGVVWQSLHSTSWHKFVWDKPQTDELMRFGVPNVHYVPMAAPDRDYNTDPLDTNEPEHVLSFVGGQNTSYFFPQNQVSAAQLLPGTLAMGVRSDMADVTFAGIYYDLYRLADPPTPADDPTTAAQKAFNYFSHKLFYNAACCIRQRDRFVWFLKRKLGDTFLLIGNRWDSTYGLPCRPQLATPDDYFAHFRRTAINLNLVNGNSESGLNMRHFEITAAGGFMLCYHAPEIDDFFEVGKECDTFHDEQELLEKVRFYLERPKERNEIAHAGQRRTLREHLYSHRLVEIRDTLSVSAAESEAIPTLGRA